jgi:hypothetical protein
VPGLVLPAGGLARFALDVVPAKAGIRHLALRWRFFVFDVVPRKRIHTTLRCVGVSFDVIPAKAGIHLDLRFPLAFYFFEVHSFRCRCAPAGNFLCWCKESHQRNTLRI